ncbi:MAG: hypothetical protein WBW85_12710 [Terriglobales bacterium]
MSWSTWWRGSLANGSRSATTSADLRACVVETVYVDDCVEGLVRIMASDHRDPINLGTDELVTINELVDMAAKIAGKL